MTPPDPLANCRVHRRVALVTHLLCDLMLAAASVKSVLHAQNRSGVSAHKRAFRRGWQPWRSRRGCGPALAMMTASMSFCFSSISRCRDTPLRWVLAKRLRRIVLVHITQGHDVFLCAFLEIAAPHPATPIPATFSFSFADRALIERRNCGASAKAPAASSRCAEIFGAQRVIDDCDDCNWLGWFLSFITIESDGSRFSDVISTAVSIQ